MDTSNLFKRIEVKWGFEGKKLTSDQLLSDRNVKPDERAALQAVAENRKLKRGRAITFANPLITTYEQAKNVLLFYAQMGGEPRTKIQGLETVEYCPLMEIGGPDGYLAEK